MTIHIEIWSDFVCPFCYIGKKNLEAALAQFPDRDDVRITWRSFELDPSEERDPAKDLYLRLAEKYGRDLAWAKQVSDEVTNTALAADIQFHLDRAVPANTFNAHRLLHLAAKHKLADSAEERLMAAYFTEGKDLGDASTLAGIGAAIGLPADETKRVLDGDQFSEDVRRDEREAVDGGIKAVPFFVFNRQFAVRGAQPVSTFLSALHNVVASTK